MNTKRFKSVSRAVIGGALAIAVVGFAAGCSAPEDDGGSTSGSGGTITLGGVLPLTGGAASFGQEWQRGVEIAVDTVNDGGGVTVDGKTYLFEANVIDDESNPAGAQNAIEQLLNNDTKFFVGPSLSSTFDSAFGILSSEDVTVFSAATAGAGKYVGTDTTARLFLTQPLIIDDDGGGLAKLVTLLADKFDPKNAAILMPQDPTGDAYLPVLTQAFADNDIDVVYSEQAPPDTRDFAPFISAIRAAEPDLVITPFLDSHVKPLIDQAVQAGFTDPIFATYGASKAAVEGHENDIHGWVWTTATRAVDNADDPVVADFREQYIDKFSEEPGPASYFALSYYDSILMLAEAMRQAGTIDDQDAIAETLKTLTTWPGQVLEAKFNKDGVVTYPLQVGVLEDGKFSTEQID